MNRQVKKYKELPHRFYVSGITSSNGYLITHEHMHVFRKKYPKLDIHMKEGTTYRRWMPC